MHGLDTFLNKMLLGLTKPEATTVGILLKKAVLKNFAIFTGTHHCPRHALFKLLATKMAEGT